MSFNGLTLKYDLEGNLNYITLKDGMATDIGTITSQWEVESPLRLKGVMYVLGLEKNLLFIIVFEYYGYDVIFRKGKVFLRHVTTGWVK